MNLRLGLEVDDTIDSKTCNDLLTYIIWVRITVEFDQLQITERRGAEPIGKCCSQIDVGDIASCNLAMQVIEVINDGFAAMNKYRRFALFNCVVFGANIVGVHDIMVVIISDTNV